MDKAQLLAALASAFHAVGDPAKVETSGNIAFYSVGVFELDGDNMLRRNESFFVENEGQGNELAYWLEKQPVPIANSSRFYRDAKDYLDLKIADGTLEAAFIDEVNEDSERATAFAYLIVASELVEKKAVLWRNASGDVQHAAVDQLA